MPVVRASASSLASKSNDELVSDSCDSDGNSKPVPWSLREMRTYQNRLTQIELSQQYTTVIVSEVLDRLERLETSQKGDLDEVKGLLSQLVRQGNACEERDSYTTPKGRVQATFPAASTPPPLSRHKTHETKMYLSSPIRHVPLHGYNRVDRAIFSREVSEQLDRGLMKDFTESRGLRPIVFSPSPSEIDENDIDHYVRPLDTRPAGVIAGNANAVNN
ncbi:hypothetical protein AAF712_013412 [Marasmius tenuissimus]|uniref:Uncharacterized protein n=1 Tax=Marasmius tenuissimus TaxID=585030 RepID=A0ABR2ZFP6_9AGAR